MCNRRILYIFVSILLPFLVLFIFSLVFSVNAESNDVCEVPSVGYTTIQSAVNDDLCDIINLHEVEYLETLIITRTVTIQGQDFHDTILDGEDTTTVIVIEAGNQVTLTNLMVTGGRAQFGGGIRNEGSSVNLVQTVISGNLAYHDEVGSLGGGIYNDSEGIIRIVDSAIISNIATGFAIGSGGGIGNQGIVTLTNSAVISNYATFGGGIYGGRGLIINSTFSGNQGGNDTSAIGGDYFINHSTVKNNSVSCSGCGEVVAMNGDITFKNSIIDNPIKNCGETIISKGYNLSSDASCIFTSTGDITNTNTLLGLLMDNGGDTLTHQILSKSPAINAGDLGFTSPPHYDQRGVGFPRVNNGRIDIGAYETNVFYTVTVHKAGEGNGTITSIPLGIDCGVTCTHHFEENGVVTLTAVADTNAIFTGWSGGGCVGLDSCVLTMTESQVVTATFKPNYIVYLPNIAKGK